MDGIIEKCLLNLYSDDDPNNLAKLEREIVKHPFENRFGILNSAFLNMCSSDHKQISWYKNLNQKMCDAGICDVPDWMHDHTSVKNLQAKIAMIKDDLLF